MIQLIESQPTIAITIICFAFSYALAMVAFGIAAMLSRKAVGEELKSISPVTLTPLAVLLGLLIAFLAARVWENVGQANETVGREATALSEAAFMADALPAEVRGKVRAALRQHVESIVTEEWPAMAKLSLRLSTESPALATAASAVLSFVPAQPQEQLAQQRALGAIAQAYEARRNRIRISRTEIAPIQWSIIVTLAALIILTTALIHIGRPRGMATALAIFATALGGCLTLLMVYDRPFAAGGITMSPAIFREINLN